MLYLVYQDAERTPVAVFTETDYFVDPRYDGDTERLVEMAHHTRGRMRSWYDWVNTLADKTPGRLGGWNAVNRRVMALPVLLRALQDSMIPEG